MYSIVIDFPGGFISGITISDLAVTERVLCWQHAQNLMKDEEIGMLEIAGKCSTAVAASASFY